VLYTLVSGIWNVFARLGLPVLALGRRNVSQVMDDDGDDIERDDPEATSACVLSPASPYS
jgi:hypothetical protein